MMDYKPIKLWKTILLMVLFLIICFGLMYTLYQYAKDYKAEQTKVDYNLTKFLKTHCKLKAIDNPFMFPHRLDGKEIMFYGKSQAYQCDDGLVYWISK